MVGHRGVPVSEPENTLRSFALARQQGADVLETDLRFTRDGEIILHHDRTLERTTDGHGAVRDHTLAEIKRLRTRKPDGTLIDEAVPTLAELIEQTGAQIPLLLELKDPRFIDPAYAGRLVRLLEATDMMARAALISFQPLHVKGVQALSPAIPTGNITLRNPLPNGNAQLLGPFWPILYSNPLYVAWAHRLGKIVAPLDPKPEPRIGYYLRLGVDAVLADHPASVIATINRYQKRSI